MSKLDEVKEILNTLRVILSLVFGAIILLVGATVARLESQKYDVWTWVGIGAIFFLLMALLFVFIMISKRTKEIKEL